ncbi:MAG: hypothetical protein ACTSVU_08610 [Promethearchaeota archaeon]
MSPLKDFPKIIINKKEKEDILKHIWIIEKKSSRMMFYYSFQGETLLDEFLLSGMLSALNHLSEAELKENGIENIDMGNLRWVFSAFNSEGILIVGAASKQSNPKLMRARLEIIGKMFIENFEIHEKYLNHWDGNTFPFLNFDLTLKMLSQQWVQASEVMNVGEIFDFLGIYQQLFIRLINIINSHFYGSDLRKLLAELIVYQGQIIEWNERLKSDQIPKDSLRLIELFIPKINLIRNKIEFEKFPATKIFGLNPLGLNQTRLNNLFMIVLRHFKKVLQKHLGNRIWLEVFQKKISPYLFANWEFLEKMNVLQEIMNCFLTINKQS